MPNNTTYMMWYSPDPKQSMDVKILEACVYFQETRGVPPDVIYLHPSAEIPNSKIRIEHRRYVLPNHMLIGAEREKAKVLPQVHS